MLDTFLLFNNVATSCIVSFFLFLWLVVFLTETAKNINRIVKHLIVLLLRLDLFITHAFLLWLF